MGAAPNPNPFGNCDVCPWTGDTPQFIFVSFSGVNRPNWHPDWPLFNTLFMLKAGAPCRWGFETVWISVVFVLGTPTKLGLGWDPLGTSHYVVTYFRDSTQDGCVTEFTNQEGLLNPNEFYHDGTGSAYLGLPDTPADWVPDFNFLPADLWKYEHMGADNNLEQLYIGSRKYKTNCRILFDPAQM